MPQHNKPQTIVLKGCITRSILLMIIVLLMVNQTINTIKLIHIVNKFYVRLDNKYAMLCNRPVYPSNQDPIGI